MPTPRLADEQRVRVLAAVQGAGQGVEQVVEQRVAGVRGAAAHPRPARVPGEVVRCGDLAREQDRGVGVGRSGRGGIGHRRSPRA
ncbi:hypothetical protein [Frigoriglobus tundricola]|uniref:hypothetical protein n=1 Tax=Frigoriglobus tundricola TaxID=2774151 RepID=UPI00148EB7A8|nr:hypothetical protein [Frigoriglobus tundricola]